MTIEPDCSRTSLPEKACNHGKECRLAQYRIEVVYVKVQKQGFNGVTEARGLLLGANASWKRIRLTLCLGSGVESRVSLWCHSY